MFFCFVFLAQDCEHSTMVNKVNAQFQGFIHCQEVDQVHARLRVKDKDYGLVLRFRYWLLTCYMMVIQGKVKGRVTLKYTCCFALNRDNIGVRLNQVRLEIRGQRHSGKLFSLLLGAYDLHYQFWDLKSTFQLCRVLYQVHNPI